MTFTPTEEPIRFLKPLKDLTVTEHDEVMMACSLNHPDREVTWFKDGQEIATIEARIKVSQRVQNNTVNFMLFNGGFSH